ncbi:MAG: MerR family transcriptional regulator [Lachnospiraceae bacterium]|nr:MerR family transcriptional regulator [Lachnospiraceae bacterium]
MKQAEKIFMISDASKQVEVEAHVLRYWEDELQLPVKRNEMGHRYYTREDIKLFQRIKEWKEQGLQLKAIRNMLKTGTLKEPMVMFGMNKQSVEEKAGPEETYIEESGGTDLARRHVIMVKKGEVVQSSIAPLQEETREQKSLRLQQLLSEMIAQAVQSNNRELCQEIKESLLKELDYQFRLQEEKEDEREMQRVTRQEEHYRQIDELIRSRNPRGKGMTDKKEMKQKEKEEKQNRQKEEKLNRQKAKEEKLRRRERKAVRESQSTVNEEIQGKNETEMLRKEGSEELDNPITDMRDQKQEDKHERILWKKKPEKTEESKETKNIFLKRKRSIV